MRIIAQYVAKYVLLNFSQIDELYDLRANVFVDVFVLNTNMQPITF